MNIKFIINIFILHFLFLFHPFYYRFYMINKYIDFGNMDFLFNNTIKHYFKHSPLKEDSMNRVLVFLMCTGLICLHALSASAQMGGFGGMGGMGGPGSQQGKVITKVALYNASEYDNKKTSILIIHEKLKREIIEDIRSDIMSSYRSECKLAVNIDTTDIPAYLSSIIKSGEGASIWDEGVLEYIASVQLDASNLAKVLCIVSNDSTLMKQIKSNQKYADDALARMSQLKNSSYDESKQDDYNRAAVIFQATNFFKEGVLSGVFKEYEDAINSYSEAIELNPGFSEAFFQRASIYRNIPDNDKAIEDYSRAIRLDEKNPRYYTGRALCYYDMQNTGSAIKDLTRAIDLKPSDSELYSAYAARGSMYEMTDMDQKALQDYKQAILISPNAKELHIRMGRINRSLKNYEESIKDFCRVIELDSEHGEAYYERGLTYAYLGEKKKVLSDFKSAARLGNTEARKLLNSKNIKWNE